MVRMQSWVQKGHPHSKCSHFKLIVVGMHEANWFRTANTLIYLNGGGNPLISAKGGPCSRLTLCSKFHRIFYFAFSSKLTSSVVIHICWMVTFLHFNNNGTVPPPFTVFCCSHCIHCVHFILHLLHLLCLLHLLRQSSHLCVILTQPDIFEHHNLA